MSNYIWLDEYKIGDETIDRQHEYLFDLANQIIDPLNDSQKTYHNVVALHHYVKEHFRDEEALMRESNYADYKEHIKEHTMLSQKLTGITAGIINGESSREDIMLFMRGWLLEHILGKDLLLGKFLRQRGKLEAASV